MKKIIFLALAIIPFLSQGQEINYTDGKCVSGNCQNGNGTYIFNNGDKYTGSFSNGKINGRGRYDYANTNAYYDGLWANGQHNDDNATYENENYKYVGSFRNNTQNGKATITFLKGNRAGDIFIGEIEKNKFKKGIYIYNPKHPERKQYKGEFTSGNNKFNGYGVLTYKNGNTDDGLWKDDVFLGAKTGEKIGMYKNLDVLKKGDTIIVIANNKKYLLSKQMPLDNKSTNGDYYAVLGLGDNIITEDGWYLDIDLDNNNNVIGYITTTSRRSNSNALYEEEKFAKSSEGHKFHEITCDDDKVIYDKFIQFCNWQICRNINTMNIGYMNYADFDKWVNEQQDILEDIQISSLKKIGTQIVADELKILLRDKNEALKTLVEHTDVSLLDGLVEASTDATMLFLTKDLDEISYVKNAKDCMLSIIKPFVSKEMQETKFYKTANNISLQEWVSGFPSQDIDELKSRVLVDNVINSSIDKAFDVISGMTGSCLSTEFKNLMAKTLPTRVLYHLLRSLPAISDVVKSGGAHVGYSIEGENVKEKILDQIKEAEQKKCFLEDYKHEYEQKFVAVESNCLEYKKVISALQSGETVTTREFKVIEEIKAQMKRYVFGNEKISQCNILNIETLKGKNNPLQQAQTTKPIAAPVLGKQTITFTEPKTLVSSTNENEMFEAVEGDIFEGEVKDGMILQGKVFRNGEVIKTFWDKRNH